MSQNVNIQTVEMSQCILYNYNRIGLLYCFESVVTPLKNRILRLMCILCAISVIFTYLPAAAYETDEGKMASMFGYVVDDYLRTYGVISNEHPQGSLECEDGTTGVVYFDEVMLDKNLPPYLVVYLTEAKYGIAACHVWKYNKYTKSAQRVAIIEKNYRSLTETVGEFSLGWTDDKKYVIYKEYSDGKPINEEYYTIIDDDAFRYVNNPPYVNAVGVMDFSSAYFHSGIDVSWYNKQISVFYDNLKNTASDSITLENFADRLDEKDEALIEKSVSRAVGFKSFDIADCKSEEEYENSLKMPQTENKFYLITHIYNLGDEIYYLRFSTNHAYYNYALVRKTDVLPDGYQILKIMTDCIPLCASELDEIKDGYMHNNLLYKKSANTLKIKPETEPKKKEKEPKIKINKVFDKRLRLPAACIGAAIVLSLLTLLWIKLYNDN